MTVVEVVSLVTLSEHCTRDSVQEVPLSVKQLLLASLGLVLVSFALSGFLGLS